MILLMSPKLTLVKVLHVGLCALSACHLLGLKLVDLYLRLMLSDLVPTHVRVPRSVPCCRGIFCPGQNVRYSLDEDLIRTYRAV